MRKREKLWKLTKDSTGRFINLPELEDLAYQNLDVVLKQCHTGIKLNKQTNGTEYQKTDPYIIICFLRMFIHFSGERRANNLCWVT